ncbi:MAG: condensation domain-containing protein, partial [Chloroflexota bacterium]
METLSPGAVLTELKNRGITLYLKEEKLKVKAKKGAMTPELQAAIKANKEALIELIKTASSAKASGSQKAGIGRKPANVEPMLSDGQERLWTLAQLASDSDVYNLPFIYEIRGGLNIERLKASVMAVASRQQVLRSSYRDLSDGPQIVFHDAIPLAFEYGDYRSEVLTQDDIYDLIARDTVKPFDLSQPPLWRLHLYQLEAERFILLGVFHHIIFDGWSADVFWNDLRHAYETPDKVQAQLPIEYVDYAYWHRTWLQSPAKAKELGYWQKVFADDVEAIKLPGQLGPSMGQNNEGELVSFKIPAELVNQLRDLAKKENYSLFMALTLIFNMTLSRYTEQEDLLICTPIAGRDQAETEGLVGFFNNIAVLRTQLEGDTPFRLQLKKMRDIILGASQNQVLPFQDVADLPNLRRIPLTRAFFALEEQTVTSKAFTLGDLTVETLPPRDYAADFDWSVFAKDLGDGLDGEIWFKRGIYDRAVVSDFASNLISVIETIVKRPTVTLNELPLFEDPT